MIRTRRTGINSLSVSTMRIATILLALVTFSAAPLAQADESSVIHVVLLWLNEPGNVEHRRELIEVSRSFASIPGIVSVKVGTPVVSEREVVDDSFDVGLYLEFRSRNALDAYRSHPAHVQAIANALQPLVAKSVIYDFVDDGR